MRTNTLSQSCAINRPVVHRWPAILRVSGEGRVESPIVVCQRRSNAHRSPLLVFTFQKRNEQTSLDILRGESCSQSSASEPLRLQCQVQE